jgi:hypothetical protein
MTSSGAGDGAGDDHSGRSFGVLISAPNSIAAAMVSDRGANLPTGVILELCPEDQTISDW